MSDKLLIKNGRLIDPMNRIDDQLDLLIVNGKVADIGRNLHYSEGTTEVDAAGLVVCPGLIDIHCHLRIPGNPEREDLSTGSRSAAMGGFTTIVPLPNTNPVIDSVEVLEYIRAEARKHSVVNILPAGAITIGERGQELAPLVELANAGVPLFSDDGQPVQNPEMMRKALEFSRCTGRALSVHCEEKSITAGGVVNLGPVSEQMGLPGYRASAEAAMVGRDIVLAKETGGWLHVDHVGYGLTVDVIRFAKSWGAHVTSECTAHHFSLTDREIQISGTNAKINPPLASEADVLAIRAGLKDGTIDVIISDHAPYTVEEKSRGLEKAPFGLIGLETTLTAVITYLVDNGVLTLSEALAKLTINPARILHGVDRGHLSIGAVADVTVFDPSITWVPDSAKYQSKSRNCPFHGKTMKGRTVHTLVDGRFVVRDGILVK